jgi:hypothetical protein
MYVALSRFGGFFAMRKEVLFFFAIILLPVSVLAQESAFVQSAKTRIMKEPNFKSGEAGIAVKGDKLSVVDKGDGWMKITFGPITGWVNNLTISSSPPMDRVVVITENSDDISSKSRKRASTMTSAAASRGLTDTDRKRLGDAGSSDYRALREVEKISAAISEKDIDNFMAIGNQQ